MIVFQIANTHILKEGIPRSANAPKKAIMMIEKDPSQFASSAWWSDHPQASMVVVHAILALSSDDRTPESIWLTPTSNEWRQVAELAAEYSAEGDFALAGDQMAWRILSRAFRGDAPPCSVSGCGSSSVHALPSVRAV